MYTTIQVDLYKCVHITVRNYNTQYYNKTSPVNDLWYVGSNLKTFGVMTISGTLKSSDPIANTSEEFDFGSGEFDIESPMIGNG